MKYQKVLAFFILHSYIALLFPLETFYTETTKKSFDKFYQYIEKAHNETQEHNWTTFVSFGKLSSIALWEQETLFLKEQDVTFWEKQRTLFLENLEKESQKHLLQWRIEKELQKTSKEYLKETSPIIHNEIQNENAPALLPQNDLSLNIENYLEDWEKDNFTIQNLYFDEFKTISEEEKISVFNSSFAKYSNFLTKELQNIYTNELQNKLITVIYNQQNSDKKNNDSHAATILEKILEELENNTTNHLDNLLQDLTTVISEENTEIILNTENWLESFNKAFNQAMVQWEQAEKNFLTERLVWETSIETNYLETIEEWENAYSKLQDNKNSWFSNLQTKYQEAIKKWQIEEEKLQAQILQTQKHFEQQWQDKEAFFLSEIEVYYTIYTQTQEILLLTIENFENWYEKTYKAAYSFWKDTNYTQEKIENLKTQKKAEITTLEKELSNLKNNPAVNTEEYHSKLLTLEEQLSFYTKSYENLENWFLKIETYKQNRDKVAEQLFSVIANEDFTDNSLNPLEVELKKVALQISYWEQEREIAAAIKNYIENFTYSDKNYDDTLANLRIAEANYTAVENQYYDELQKLKTIENIINENKKNIENSKTTYEMSLIELENIKNEYSEMLSLISTTNGTLLENQITDTIENITNIFQETQNHEYFFSSLEKYSTLKIQEEYKILIEKIITDSITTQEITEKINGLKQLEASKASLDFSYENYVKELLSNYIPDEYHNIYERLVTLQKSSQENTIALSDYNDEISLYCNFLIIYWENYLLQTKETISYILSGKFLTETNLTLEEALKLENLERNNFAINSSLNTTQNSIEIELSLYKKNITQTKMQNLIRETYKNYSIPELYLQEINRIQNMSEQLTKLYENISTIDLTNLLEELLKLENLEKNSQLYETKIIYQTIKNKLLKKYARETYQTTETTSKVIQTSEEIEKNILDLQREFQTISQNYTSPTFLFELMTQSHNPSIQKNIVNLIAYSIINHFDFLNLPSKENIETWYTKNYREYSDLSQELKELLNTSTLSILSLYNLYKTYETAIQNYVNPINNTESVKNNATDYFLYLLSLNKDCYSEEELKNLTENQRHILQENADFVAHYNTCKDLSLNEVMDYISKHSENIPQQQLLVYSLTIQNPFANNFFYAEYNFSLLQAQGIYYFQNKEIDVIKDSYTTQIKEYEKKSIENSILFQIQEEQDKLKKYESLFLEAKQLSFIDLNTQDFYSQKEARLDEELLEGLSQIHQTFQQGYSNLSTVLSENYINAEFPSKKNELDTLYKDFSSVEHSFFYQDFLEERLFSTLETKMNLYSQTNLSEEVQEITLQQIELTIEQTEKDILENEKKYLEELNALDNLYTQYNNQIDIITEIQKELKHKKTEQKIKQEIYDWVSTIYLNESTDFSPQEKLESANSKLIFFQKLQENLQEKIISNQNSDETLTTLLENYKKDYTALYTGLALENDIYKEIIIQETKIKDQENSIKNIENSLITSVMLENLPLSVEVANKYLIQEEPFTISYFNEKNEQVLFYDSTENKSKAEIEALNWIQSIFIEETKGKEYFYELSLAAFYLLHSNSLENTTDYSVNNFYSALQNYQGIFHDTDILQYFSESFEQVLASHYTKIIQNENSKNDLINYLVFRDTNLSHLNLETMEKNLINQLTLKETMTKINSRCDSLKETAVAFGIISASNAALAGLLWFNPIAVAYYASLSVSALLVTTDSLNKKDKLEEINKDLSVYSTNYSILLENNSSLENTVAILQSEYSQLNETKLQLESVLNNSSNEKLTFKTFIENLKLLLEKGKKNYYQTTTIEDLETICSKENYINAKILETDTVSHAFQKIITFLQLNFEESFQEFTTYLLENEVLVKNQIQNLSAIIQKAEKSPEISMDYYNNLLKETENYCNSFLIDSCYSSFVELYKKIGYQFANYEEKNVFYETNNITNYTTTLQEILTALKQKESDTLNFELSQKYENFQKELNEWTLKMQEIVSLSEKTWNKNLEKFEKEFASWKNDFSRQYQKKSSEWQENYNSFIEKKKNWILQQYLFAADTSTLSLALNSDELNEILISAQGFIQSAKEDFLQTDISPKALAQEVLESSELKLIETIFDKKREITSFDPITSFTKKNIQKVQETFLAEKLVLGMNDKIKTLASQISVISAQKQYDEFLESLNAKITNENLKMHQWQENLVLTAGYSISGNSIYRDAIIDATVLGGTERQRQFVHYYQDYIPQEFTSQIKFSSKNIQQYDDEVLQNHLDNLHWEIKKYLEKIFGPEENRQQIEVKRSDFFNNEISQFQIKSQTNNGNLSQEELKLKTKLENKMQEEFLSPEEMELYNELLSKNVIIQQGDFGRYLGFAPYFNPFKQVTKTSNVEDFIFAQGSGQIGLIMKDFQWNQLVTNAGLQEFIKPSYDLRLWDDSNSWFEAPTIREITDIALTTISSLTTGGIANGLVNLTDDLFFSLLDYSGNYKSAEEIGKNLGKQLLLQASSVLTGNFSKDSNMLDFFLKDANDTTKILAQGTKSFITQYGKTVLSSAVTSLSINNGNISFNTDNFIDTIFSGKALGNALASGITTSLTQWNLGTQSGNENFAKVIGFNSNQIKDIHTLNNLAGNLVQNVVSFALDGETTFNILNSGDFNFGNTGLFSLNISQNGITGKLSTEGTNISYSTLISSFNGLNHWQINTDINNLVNSAYYENQILAQGLRTLYGFGTQQEILQLENFIMGKDIIRLNNENDFYGKTVFDKETKIVEIKTPVNWLETGLILSHESYRNGVINSSQEQLEETMNAVIGHTELFNNLAKDSFYTKNVMEYFFNDSNIQQDYMHYLFDNENFSEYVYQNYDSTHDYWKLLKDGTIIYDGKYDVFNEDNQLIYKSSSNTMEESLIEILVGKDASEIDKQRVLNLIKDSFRGSNTTLYSNDIWMNYGNIIASELFVYHYDESVDTYIESRKTGIFTDDAKRKNLTSIQRYYNLYQTKTNFYKQIQRIVESNYTYISQNYQEDFSPHYKNYDGKHFGIDLIVYDKYGNISEAPITAGIPGKIIYTTNEEIGAGNGNSVYIEYGYLFEDNFIGTGLFGEYLHLAQETSLSINSLVTGNTELGIMGNTGSSTNIHLHYSIYSVPDKKISYSTAKTIFGKNIQETKMINSLNTKTVYNPYFYISNHTNN